MIYEQSRLSDIFVLAYLLLASSTLLFAQPFYTSTSELPTSWLNQPSMSAGYNGVQHSLSPVLLRENTDGSNFVLGFYCISTDGIFNVSESESRDCTFGVLISTNMTDDYFRSAPMLLVWSANRNDPVQVNATLQLNENGDLSLQNADGTLVWSSHTGGKSVAGMNLTESGNLVLFGKNEEAIWQSFDHPTDTLFLGQKLMGGQRLISSVSASNQSEGLFYISIYNKGLAAFTNSRPPQGYYFSFFDVSFGLPNDTYLDFTSNSLEYYNISSASRFMKLGSDGHLKVFQPGENDWEESADVFSPRPCDYPMVCGTYGVCSDAGQCSCPEALSGQQGLFVQKNFRQPNLGCSLVTPISCSHSRDHTLMELKNTYYFVLSFSSYEEDTLKEDCKNRCLNNCSCKAALFAKLSFSNDSSEGRCLLLNDVFSIVNNENPITSGYNTTLFVKVQLPHANASRRKTVILASSLSAAFGIISMIGGCLLFRKLNRKSIDAEEDFLEHVPGMPARYSYEELKAATADFSAKLGEGGFGSVYEGELSDGTKIAVKCLDSLGRIRDSFLVEVKAIASIQHVNLVKLMGFCFEKSHRLLVYEYMANRSLDGWIFSGQGRKSLPWDTRKRIISEIAKGLAYLHEDCNHKIIHLDIKLQNILLDQNFNAKIGDFGLSKLIEKDQSRVITTMRGTPGYLAPEWLSSVITEKVDVYSFGIVMLEIICGRKNLDWSKAEEDKHLLNVFKNKAEEGKLEELADEGTEEHIEEAVEMMGIAAWCLQGDFMRRPSMSIVVKVLEGLVEAETNLNYDFLNPTIVRKRVADVLTEVQPSALSGPR